MTSDLREQAIREIAYSKWEHAGWPSGDGRDFWLDAEHEFDSQQSPKGLGDDATVPETSASAAIDPPPLKMTKGGNSRKKAG